MSAPLKKVSDLEVFEKNDWVGILKNVKLFAGLKSNTEALTALSKSMRLQKLAKNHILIEEDQLGDQFFILIEGEVSIHKKTPEGDIFKVALLSSRGLSSAGLSATDSNGTQFTGFGEGGLVEAEPRSATVRCDTDCSCLVLNRAEFDLFAQKNPQWAIPVYKNLFQSLMSRLKKMNMDLLLLHKALTTEIRGE